MIRIGNAEIHKKRDDELLFQMLLRVHQREQEVESQAVASNVADFKVVNNQLIKTFFSFFETKEKKLFFIHFFNLLSSNDLKMFL